MYQRRLDRNWQASWRLSGANTYTGGTTISAGTLQIGNGGTTGSLSTSNTITDNASLIFNRTNAVTQALVQRASSAALVRCRRKPAPAR